MRSLLLGFSLALAGCANAPQPSVLVPNTLAAAPAESLAMIVPAKGVQIYECRAMKGWGGGLDWAFVAPEAELFDANGNTIGRHYAGPHWESKDGSRIVAAVKQRADAPDRDAIPWLLLSSKSVGPEGAFSRVTSIQRVSTVGGVAPAGGCTRIGDRAHIPYSADYYFFTAK